MSQEPFANYIQEYWNAIQTHRVNAGKWIQLLYSMITRGLDSGQYFFDAKKANKAIRFIENYCHHCEGRNDLLKLELWQKADISVIFGIVDEYGFRNWRECFLVMGRKNGKSLLASAIIAYMAYMDGEHGAKIYCLAPKLEQAGIVFDNFWQMLRAEPELSGLADKRRSDIYLAGTNTSVRPLAFNAKKSDGFNPHLTVCDEIASWPAELGLKQYEVMKSALGARRQPLILSISTAGYVSDGPYDELMMRSTAVLNGTSKERRLLPILYIIDDPEKWNDLDELRKSNPNMGVSVSEDFFREEIAIAENSLSKRVEFLTKYCNLKQNAVSAWLPYSVIDAVSQEDFNLDDARGLYCCAGVDLSQTTDLTAACIVVEKEEKLHVICHFWMPANKIDELQAREGVPYRIYEQQGILSLSGENYVDYTDVFNWFRMLVEEYEILPLQVGYDRYSSQYLIQSMQQYGFHCDDVFQGWNLSSIILEADGQLRDQTLQLGRNNLLKAHFMNSALKQNTENRKYQLVKVDPRCHIDGCVAVIDALTVRQKWFDQIGAQLRNE